MPHPQGLLGGAASFLGFGGGHPQQPPPPAPPPVPLGSPVIPQQQQQQQPGAVGPLQAGPIQQGNVAPQQPFSTPSTVLGPQPQQQQQQQQQPQPQGFAQRLGISPEQEQQLIRLSHANPEAANKILRDLQTRSITEQEPAQFRNLSAQEAREVGLDPAKPWQINEETGRILPVGGGGSTVNVNLPGEAEEDPFRKADIETVKVFSTTVASARELMPIVRQAARLAVLTRGGPVAKASLPLRNFLADVGIITDPAKLQNITNETATQAINSYIAPRMRVIGSGATSDFEARQFLQAAGQLADPQAARILNTAARLNIIERVIASSSTVRQYMRDNPKAGIDQAFAFANEKLGPSVPSITDDAAGKSAFDKLKHGQGYLIPGVGYGVKGIMAPLGVK